jgi:ribosomal protein S18 acetylase RimI-like enzyme
MSRILRKKAAHTDSPSAHAGTGMAAGLRWRKMPRRSNADVEKLLRDREPWCVSACGRFLRRRSSGDAVWTLHGRDGGIHALIVYSNRTLLPVFGGHTDIPEPEILKGLFGALPVHSIQGLADEALFLEDYLYGCGLKAIDAIDYDLMYIELPPGGNCGPAPAGLVLRRARHGDLDALAELQAGYEQEEVLPRGAVFYPAASRRNTEKIFSSEQLLVAELDGRLVGKINTSVLSYTRFQIGGVYVLPDFRGRGIARHMTAEFVHSLIEQGRGVTLFVKKANRAAQKVYCRLGFKFLADYRISYY